jgi:hypothetical protein
MIAAALHVLNVLERNEVASWHRIISKEAVFSPHPTMVVLYHFL